MKKRLLVGLLAGLFTTFIAIESNASIINEVAGNDTLASAQNIDGAFSTGTNSDIYGANTGLPWVSINATGDGTYDYFSFTVTAGTTGYFDIDYGYNWQHSGSIDTEIALWDATGTVLMERDDGSNYQSITDSGTVSILDPSISYTFSTTGTYIIGVAEFYAYANNGGWGGNTPDSGDTYTLQVSLTDHPTNPVPEPATMLLFGTGLAGLVGMRRKKSRK